MITALLATTWATDPASFGGPTNAPRLLLDYPPQAGEEYRDVTQQRGSAIPPDRNAVLIIVTVTAARAQLIAADPSALVLRRFDRQGEGTTLTSAQRMALRNWLQARGITLAEVQSFLGTDATLATLTRRQVYLALRGWLRQRQRAA